MFDPRRNESAIIKEIDAIITSWIKAIFARLYIFDNILGHAGLSNGETIAYSIV